MYTYLSRGLMIACSAQKAMEQWPGARQASGVLAGREADKGLEKTAGKGPDRTHVASGPQAGGGRRWGRAP